MLGGMEFKVILVERGETCELHTMGYLPEASTVVTHDGRDLAVAGHEVEDKGGWIYVVDPKNRVKP